MKVKITSSILERTIKDADDERIEQLKRLEVARTLTRHLLAYGKMDITTRRMANGDLFIEQEFVIISGEEYAASMRCLVDLLSSENLSKGDQFNVRKLTNIIYGYEKFPLIEDGKKV